ncbi:MAG: ArsA family ATPase, partial [Myxococcota bacterium]
MVDLFGKRLIINTGKGGVGKTTLSAAIGLAAARRGKRVLLMELNAKEKTSRLFGSSPIGFEPTEVEENLFAVNITPKEAMREYAILKLRLKTLYRAVFENRFVRTFLRAIPGINELVLLGKVWYEEQARDGQGGRPRWDMIVVDAPATGHGIFFLQIPQVVTSIISSGPMFDEARQIQEMIQDRSRTLLNLITLVEEMPVNETIELKHTTEEILKVPLGYVIANAVYQPMFTTRQRQLVDAVRPQVDNDDGTLDRLLE